ncbi:hypothetical protein BH23VER1_BH23VER1_19480 [soil metagenome]
MSEPPKDALKESELPPNLQQLWKKSSSAIDAKNYQYAVAILLSILQKEPGFLTGRRYLRSAAAKAKETQKKGLGFGGGGFNLMSSKKLMAKDPMAAIQEIEKEVLANDPYNIQANELLYTIAIGEQMVDTAAFALETIYEGHPGNKKNGHRLAEHYITHGQADKASHIYSDISRRDPTDLKAIKGATDATARASMAKGGWDAAASFKDVLKNKGEASDLEKGARTAMTKEQIENEIARLGEQYEKDQSDLRVVKRIAQLYEQAENYPESLTWYDYAHQISGGDVALETKVHRLQDRVRDNEIDAIQAELTENPDPEKQAHLDELMKERSINLIADSRRRVDRNPTDPILRYELGENLYNAGDYSEAIRQLQKAKNSPHIRTKVLLTLGKCFEHKGMNDLAVTQLEAATSELSLMDHTKKEILYTLGLIHAKMGNTEKSMDALKQIYEADYSYRDVAERVEASYGED